METDGCETIVWRARERDKIDLCGWLCDGDFASVADGDLEESSSVCHSSDPLLPLKERGFCEEAEAVDESLLLRTSKR